MAQPDLLGIIEHSTQQDHWVYRQRIAGGLTTSEDAFAYVDVLKHHKRLYATKEIVVFCFVAGDERHAAHRIAELKCLRAWAVQVQLSGVPSARSNSRGGLSNHVLSILRSRIQGAGVSPRLREAVNNRPLTAGLVLQRLVAKHVGGDKAGAQATEPSAKRLRTADLNLGALCDPDCDKLVRAAAQICYYSYRSGTTDGALAGVFISNDECFTYVCETMKLVRYDLGMSGVGTGMVRIDGPFPITPAGVGTEVLVWPVHRWGDAGGKPPLMGINCGSPGWSYLRPAAYQRGACTRTHTQTHERERERERERGRDPPPLPPRDCRQWDRGTSSGS